MAIPSHRHSTKPSILLKTVHDLAVARFMDTIHTPHAIDLWEMSANEYHAAVKKHSRDCIKKAKEDYTAFMQEHKFTEVSLPSGHPNISIGVTIPFWIDLNTESIYSSKWGILDKLLGSYYSGANAVSIYGNMDAIIRPDHTLAQLTRIKTNGEERVMALYTSLE